MSIVVQIPGEVTIPRKLWTREEAHQLVERGIPNAEKLQLIEGDLIDRMGKKRPHILWHSRIRNWAMGTFGADFVQSEDPIDVAPGDMPTSEPEPDLSITTKPLSAFAENPKPHELRLVVEISDTTLAFDLKIKGPLYARAGIAEYWVVDINNLQLIVHREPQGGTYTSVTTYDRSESVSPLAAPEVRFRLDQLISA